MTDIIVEPENDSPDNDTDIVVAPTIVVEAPPAVEPPIEEAVEEVVEEVVEETIDLAVMVGSLAERVTALEVANIVVDEPVVVVEESGDGDVDVDVEVDNTPTKVPWTHKRWFGGRD